MKKCSVTIALTLGLFTSLFGQEKFNWTDSLFSLGQSRTIKLKRAFNGPCTAKPCYDFATNKQTYDTLIDFMNNNKEVFVNFVWHTGTDDGSDYNLAISRKMSEGLINELIRQEIDKTRISAIGFGEARPLFSEDQLERILDTEQRREKDRMNERIEVVIVSAPNKMYK